MKIIKARFPPAIRYSSFHVDHRGKKSQPALYLLLDQAGEIQHGVVATELRMDSEAQLDA
jgi:hypothetical protein